MIALEPVAALLNDHGWQKREWLRNDLVTLQAITHEQKSESNMLWAMRRKSYGFAQKIDVTGRKPILELVRVINSAIPAT